MRKSLFPFAAVALALMFITISVSAQLPVPKNIQQAYNKNTRNHSGLPGKNYWQNTAHYDLNVHFDPRSLLLSGIEAITYINHSPDTLKKVVFKLYPNLYQKGSTRLMKIQPSDVGDGMQIHSMQCNGTKLSDKDMRFNSTNMEVFVNVLPGDTIHFLVDYSYVLNRTSHIRTGEIEPGADFIAYFFPRITVYDDIDGWNMNPYLGTQEFYNDFCDFNLSVTVPRRFIVWATGNQTNAHQVFQPEYIQRLQKAETQDGYIAIIPKDEIHKKGITRSDSLLTWKFEAHHITDVAFALSDHYTWVSTSVEVDPFTKRRTRVDAVYNPAHTDYESVIEDARKTVEYMSYRFPKWPFPFAHITVVDGLDQMEYPMMVNDNPVADRAESIELTDHEIFHSMFPFYMGINETKYGWMDEGWATIGEWLISPMIDSSLVDLYGVARYAHNAGNEIDLPITTLTTQLTRDAMFINNYPKPAMGYLFVKDMLGDQLFFKALHQYIRSWNGKHPMPYDFFNSMNTGAGENLDWFWKNWFFESGEPDLAVGNLTSTANSRSVKIIRKGSKYVPVHLTVLYSDGSKETIHRTISVWKKAAKQITISVPGIKKISQIVLHGDHIPDSNPEDNIRVF